MSFSAESDIRAFAPGNLLRGLDAVKTNASSTDGGPDDLDKVRSSERCITAPQTRG
jgi:hypothetical protein